MGHFALVLGDAAVGDHVFVAHDATNPFILRPTVDDESFDGVRERRGISTFYNFVGGSYVHGIMDGEVLNMIDGVTVREEKCLSDVIWSHSSIDVLDHFKTYEAMLAKNLMPRLLSSGLLLFSLDPLHWCSVFKGSVLTPSSCLHRIFEEFRPLSRDPPDNSHLSNASECCQGLQDLLVDVDRLPA